MNSVTDSVNVAEAGVEHEIDSVRVAGGIATFNSAVSAIMGGAMLAVNSTEVYAVQLLTLVALSSAALAVVVRSRLKAIEFPLLALALAAVASAVIISFLPDYMRGLGFRGIMHRSLISGLLLLIIAVPSACYAMYYCLGATPRAFDKSRYPLLITIATATVAGFGLVAFYIVKNGAIQLDWSIISTQFVSQSRIVETWKDGWPTFSSVNVKSIGMLNHITGTLLLMGLTSLISLPIGVGVGVFVNEYAGRKLGGMITYSTTALRSISGIIIAVTAVSLLSMPEKGSLVYNIFHGYGNDVNSVVQMGKSSFIFASAFISLLVIPIVARATQEGLGSLPGEIREGSLGLGASREHTLFRLQLPWALPNIITGLMLGCAEAAGALSIIFLIAGTGEFGISPLNETTSLAFLIFDIKYGTILGDAAVQNTMADYQYTAALVLLIMTLGLTAAALIMKKHLEKRYKGAR
jgi:phosphate transport system permease protein